MSARTPALVSRLRGFVDVLDGAFAAAVDAEGGRRPSPVALNKLGIHPRAFDAVRVR